MTHPNYNLALRLKESGFPQNVPYDELLYGPEVTQDQVALIDKGEKLDVETVIWPSTNALIEELGDNISQIHKVKGNEFNGMEDHWIVYTPKETVHLVVDENGKYPTGTNPKLALINLYLALHDSR